MRLETCAQIHVALSITLDRPAAPEEHGRTWEWPAGAKADLDAARLIDTQIQQDYRRFGITA